MVHIITRTKERGEPSSLPGAVTAYLFSGKELATCVMPMDISFFSHLTQNHAPRSIYGHQGRPPFSRPRTWQHHFSLHEITCLYNSIPLHNSHLILLCVLLYIPYYWGRSFMSFEFRVYSLQYLVCVSVTAILAPQATGRPNNDKIRAWIKKGDVYTWNKSYGVKQAFTPTRIGYTIPRRI